MPLLDHFRRPLSGRRHWQGFHSSWASSIARLLNRDLLPPHYFAEPNVQLAGAVEIDVATFDEGQTGASGAGTATATWAPPRPPLVVPLDSAHLETFEVQVFSEEGGPRLVAAIELVSPANKDRPAHRRAFATKCAAYLTQGVGLTVVDAVTTRTENLHVELLALLGLADASAGAPEPLHASAYRVRTSMAAAQLEAWPQTLRLGEPLPTLPLWLAPDVSLPLDLEESYATTCESLRIGG